MKVCVSFLRGCAPEGLDIVCAIPTHTSPFPFYYIGIRIRQWERILLEELYNLQVLKGYRTPQALRSLSRLLSVLLPPFYAPFYAQLGRSVHSLATGIIFAAVAALALTGLFESLTQMEDPFLPHVTLDGIHVHHEMCVVLQSQLFAQRNYVFFERAKPFQSKKQVVDEATKRKFRRMDSPLIMMGE
mmetsp:Transcript_25977/g.60311  ORF Transcript_25977/g.60311 Transcript_25977/m.60311 type:complete len:187 (-) Transcript_25977:1022-1582(-)